jgi:hypothetical protein
MYQKNEACIILVRNLIVKMIESILKRHTKDPLVLGKGLVLSIELLDQELDHLVGFSCTLLDNIVKIRVNNRSLYLLVPIWASITAMSTGGCALYGGADGPRLRVRWSTTWCRG